MTHPIEVRPRRCSAAHVAQRVASVEPLAAGRQVDTGQWVGDGLRQAHLNPAEGVDDAAEPAEPADAETPDPQAAATALLTRALQIGLEKDDDEWLHNSTVKAQMKRMDPSFSEKSLGFRSFSDFLRSRTDVVALDETSTTRWVKLR